MIPNVNRNTVGFSQPVYPYTCKNCVSVLDATHPPVTWPSSIGRYVFITTGQSQAAQYLNSVSSVSTSNVQYEFTAIDGTLREFVEPIFGSNGNRDLGAYSAATTYFSSLRDQVDHLGVSWYFWDTTITGGVTGVTPGTNPAVWSGALVGSLWGYLGNLLISAGRCQSVVWVPVALGGTFAYEWASTGQYGQNVTTAITRLSDVGVEPTGVLQMLGESDGRANTPSSVYYSYGADQINLSRNNGYNGPWFIARESRVILSGVSSVNPDIIAAQNQLIATLPNVKAGPSLDDLDTTYRFLLNNDDETHFNGITGRDTVSSRWRTALIAGGL